jgi:homoserine trans-succinylase
VPYPRVPEAYFGPAALATLDAFERRARMSTDEPLKLWERFPHDEVAADVENSWGSASTAFYANWLGLARQSICP